MRALPKSEAWKLPFMLCPGCGRPHSPVIAKEAVAKREKVFCSARCERAALAPAPVAVPLAA